MRLSVVKVFVSLLLVLMAGGMLLGGTAAMAQTGAAGWNSCGWNE